MAEVSAEVLMAVPLTSDTDARTWFSALSDEYEELSDYDGLDDSELQALLVEQLTARETAGNLPANSVTAFEKFLADKSMSLLDTVKAMHGLGVDTLVQRRANAAADAGGDKKPYNPEDWNAYLKANGPRWDGTEQNWAAFRAWFAHADGKSELAAAAESFLKYVEAGDKRARFAEYGITVGAPPATGRGHDQKAWEDYLRTNGPRWDGSEQTWKQFRDWFEYHAVQQGLGTPAAEFLKSAEDGGKQVVFANAGIVLVTAPPVVQDKPAEDKPAVETTGEAEAREDLELLKDLELMDPTLKDLDFDAMTEEMDEIGPDGSVVLDARDLSPAELEDLYSVQKALGLKTDLVAGPVTEQALDDYIREHGLDTELAAADQADTDDESVLSN